jgi:hypothetical protein
MNKRLHIYFWHMTKYNKRVAATKLGWQLFVLQNSRWATLPTRVQQKEGERWPQNVLRKNAKFLAQIF